MRATHARTESPPVRSEHLADGKHRRDEGPSRNTANPFKKPPNWAHLAKLAPTRCHQNPRSPVLGGLAFPEFFAYMLEEIVTSRIETDEIARPTSMPLGRVRQRHHLGLQAPAARGLLQRVARLTGLISVARAVPRAGKGVSERRRLWSAQRFVLLLVLLDLTVGLCIAFAATLTGSMDSLADVFVFASWLTVWFVCSTEVGGFSLLGGFSSRREMLETFALSIRSGATALAVWYDARAAAGEAPTTDRVRRVVEKLTDPDALLVVARRSGEGCGMALAEPFRADGGQGVVLPDQGHISMVFVRGDRQGRGVGRELMEQLIVEAPWSRLSLWTRESNHRAQRLYLGCGFVPTGDLGTTPSLEPTQRWARR